MPKETRIIYVKWVDSISYGSSVWTNKDVVVKSEAGLPVLESVGFLLKETADAVVIAGHVGDGSISGDMSIPKVAIKKRRWLR